MHTHCRQCWISWIHLMDTFMLQCTMPDAGLCDRSRSFLSTRCHSAAMSARAHLNNPKVFVQALNFRVWKIRLTKDYQFSARSIGQAYPHAHRGTACALSDWSDCLHSALVVTQQVNLRSRSTVTCLNSNQSTRRQAAFPITARTPGAQGDKCECLEARHVDICH